jgi:hypothetical protein
VLFVVSTVIGSVWFLVLFEVIFEVFAHALFASDSVAVGTAKPSANAHPVHSHPSGGRFFTAAYITAYLLSVLAQHQLNRYFLASPNQSSSTSSAASTNTSTANAIPLTAPMNTNSAPSVGPSPTVLSIGASGNASSASSADSPPLAPTAPLSNVTPEVSPSLSPAPAPNASVPPVASTSSAHEFEYSSDEEDHAWSSQPPLTVVMSKEALAEYCASLGRSYLVYCTSLLLLLLFGFLLVSMLHMSARAFAVLSLPLSGLTNWYLLRTCLPVSSPGSSHSTPLAQTRSFAHGHNKPSTAVVPGAPHSVHRQHLASSDFRSIA